MQYPGFAAIQQLYEMWLTKNDALNTAKTRQHWIQCNTFAAETKAGNMHSVTDGGRATHLPSLLAKRR